MNKDELVIPDTLCEECSWIVLGVVFVISPVESVGGLGQWRVKLFIGPGHRVSLVLIVTTAETSENRRIKSSALSAKTRRLVGDSKNALKFNPNMCADRARLRVS